MLAGLGHPQYAMFLGLAGLVINLNGTLATARSLASLSIVLGAGLGTALPALCFMPAQHRLLQIGNLEVLRRCLWQPLAAGASTAMLTYLTGFDDWCGTLPRVLASVPLFAAVYGVSLLLLGVPCLEDRDLVERYAPRRIATLLGFGK